MPETGLGEDGEIANLECAAFERGDDGLCHVGDQDGHGWDGDQGPDDEERFSCVAFGGQVSVADGQQAHVAEIEGFEIGHVLSGFLGLPEDDGSDTPEDAKCTDGDHQRIPLFPGFGVELDLSHGVKAIFLLPHDDDLGRL